MTTQPDAPQNLRIVHADGTHTPVEVVYIGKEPRQVGDEIYILDKWEITTVVAWRRGDHLDADWMPDATIIGLNRVGTR